MSSFVGVDSDTLLRDFKKSFNKLSEKYLVDIVAVWADIFGSANPDIEERFSELKNQFQQFWDTQIKNVETMKNEKIDKIEALAKQTYELECALGLNPSLSSSLGDIPLVELEDQQNKQLKEYQKLKDERIAKYTNLQRRIEELSTILGYPEGQHIPFPDYTMLSVTSNVCTGDIPTMNDLQRSSQLVNELEQRRENLKSQFISLKEELRLLLKECDIAPFTKIERYACSLNGEYHLACNKLNLDKLQEDIEKYSLIKQSNEAESSALKDEIVSLSRKMLKSEVDVQQFILEHQGFKRSVIDQLKKKLALLKSERMENITELILKQRETLDDLWNKCCYSDDQRKQFLAYSSNHYTEDVLTLHELEVEQLQNFYYNNREIFNLAKQHDELWQRLLHLENESKRSDRLFNNRGGQLLKEEKERKHVHKTLPAVRNKLINMLKNHKSLYGTDILYYGVPLLDNLEQLEMERQASKENERQQRKTRNTDKRPTSTAQNKRRLLTPQTILSPKLVKMMNQTTTSKTSNSTPTNGQNDIHTTNHDLRLTKQVDNYTVNYLTPRIHISDHQTLSIPSSSPTYESFQQHMDAVNDKDCFNSTKNVDSNLLNTINQNANSQLMMPNSMPKTPNETPSKAPFLIATGLKIPSIVQPVTPKSASKNKTPRRNLPIIF